MSYWRNLFSCKIKKKTYPRRITVILVYKFHTTHGSETMLWICGAKRVECETMLCENVTDRCSETGTSRISLLWKTTSVFIGNVEKIDISSNDLCIIQSLSIQFPFFSLSLMLCLLLFRSACITENSCSMDVTVTVQFFPQPPDFYTQR